MATFIDVEKVKYLCSCERTIPYLFLYFCRHCLKLRCPECVSHEVDTIFCPSCLEGMPSIEAMAKKNRCNNCYDCPCCQHTLSTRATSQPKQDGAKSSGKVYYLACGFCRWSSRDAGIPDQTVASGGWQVFENPDHKKIASVMELFHQLNLQEQSEKLKKKQQQKKKGGGFMYNMSQDKYKLSSVAFRHRSAVSTPTFKESDLINAAKSAVSVATDEIEGLPIDIYTGCDMYAAPHDFNGILDISQRYSQPEQQAMHAVELHPNKKHLMVKQSQRCKECEHNLIKPEFNPSSVKYKIHQTAYSYVPGLAVKAMSTPLAVGKQSIVTLTVVNPLQYPMTFALLATDHERCIEAATARLELPEDVSLTLAAKDDAAVYDEASLEIGEEEAKCDPPCVMFRKANKMGVAVRVVPERAGDVVVGVALKYTFRSALIQLSQVVGAGDGNHNDVVWLQQHVVLHVGTVN